MEAGASGHLENLRGVAWARRPYRQWTKAWDHDHCEVCDASFSEDHPGDLRDGWTTTAGYEMGAEYCWVCSDCFDRCRDEMDWAVVSDPRPVREPGSAPDGSPWSKEARLHDS
jgi:hypothetical protein